MEKGMFKLMKKGRLILMKKGRLLLMEKGRLMLMEKGRLMLMKERQELSKAQHVTSCNKIPELEPELLLKALDANCYNRE